MWDDVNFKLFVGLKFMFLLLIAFLVNPYIIIINHFRSYHFQLYIVQTLIDPYF